MTKLGSQRMLERDYLLEPGPGSLWATRSQVLRRLAGTEQGSESLD